MRAHRYLWIAVVAWLTFGSVGRADDSQNRGGERPSPLEAAGELLRLGSGLGRAPTDLRVAGEAAERAAGLLAGPLDSIAQALATMSSEFDPFGYKTAFRTIGQQAEIIERQQATIQELQEREILRLREELETLRSERTPAAIGKSKKAGKRKSGD